MDLLIDATEVFATALKDIFLATEIGTFVGFLLLVVVLGGVSLVYAIPTIVAFKRSHHRKAAIVTLNLLLGWTFLGWVAALALSGSNVRHV